MLTIDNGTCPKCNSEFDSNRECQKCGIRETTIPVNKVYRTFEPITFLPENLPKAFDGTYPNPTRPREV